MLESLSLQGIAPAALAPWVAAAAGLLLLFLMLRPRPQKVDVPSDLLWTRALQRAPNPLLRDLLLLVLQLAILAALSLALLEPHPQDGLQGAEAIHPAAQADRIWVLDSSISMGAVNEQGNSRLDRVRTSILERLEDLTGAELALIEAGSRPVLRAAPNSSDRARLRLALEQLQAMEPRSDFVAALDRAAALKTRQPGTPIEVFTDVPDAGEQLSRWHQSRAARGLGAREVLLRAPFMLRPNLAIRAFGLRGSEGIPAEEEAFVRVANHSPWPATTQLSLENESQVVGQTTLRLQPGEELSRRYRFDPLEDLALLARLEDTKFESEEGILSDALAVDDIAWDFVEPVRPVRVMLVSEGNRYLERALALLPKVELDRLRPRSWNRAAAARASEADLVFFDRFVPQGALPSRSFLIAPPWEQGPFGMLKLDDGPAITDWHREHPLFSGLVLRDLEVRRSVVFEPQLGDVALLGGPSGPLALARESAEGDRMIAWGFAFGDSDLPLRLAFPQILVNSILWMREGRTGQAAVGQSLPLGDEITLASGGAIHRLDRLTELSSGSGGEHVGSVLVGAGPAPLRLPGPGLYRVGQGTSARLFAQPVLGSVESQLFPLPAQDVQPLPEPGEKPAEEPSSPLWTLLVLGGLVLLIFEFGLWVR